MQVMAAQPRLVLIVDDDQPVRELEVTILDDAGYEVQDAADGAAAIERLDARRPDLVLLDLVMPGVDGWGVLEHIHGMASPPPVVVISGAHEILPPGHLTRYVTGYVFKPFDVTQLLRTCDAALASASVVPKGGNRKESRRTFLVETTLVSESGLPLAQAQLLQVSRGGFRVELAIPLQTGDPVRIAFRVPGRSEPLILQGHVRWRQDFTLGAEIENLSPEHERILREIAEPTD
jgi:CheY-like chemotaxis protein